MEKVANICQVYQIFQITFAVFRKFNRTSQISVFKIKKFKKIAPNHYEEQLLDQAYQSEFLLFSSSPLVSSVILTDLLWTPAGDLICADQQSSIFKIVIPDAAISAEGWGLA